MRRAEERAAERRITHLALRGAEPDGEIDRQHGIVDPRLLEHLGRALVVAQCVGRRE